MNIETPYLEDNNRKGATHGEAIFGDKQAQFNLPVVGNESNLTDAGNHEMASVEKQEWETSNATSNSLGEVATLNARKAVALTELANQYSNMSEEQLMKIASRQH